MGGWCLEIEIWVLHAPCLLKRRKKAKIGIYNVQIAMEAQQTERLFPPKGVFTEEMVFELSRVFQTEVKVEGVGGGRSGKKYMLAVSRASDCRLIMVVALLLFSHYINISSFRKLLSLYK